MISGYDACVLGSRLCLMFNSGAALLFFTGWQAGAFVVLPRTQLKGLFARLSLGWGWPAILSDGDRSHRKQSQRRMKGWRHTVGNLIEFVWLAKTGGTVSSNSRFQAVLSQQYSANLSIEVYIYIYIYTHMHIHAYIHIYINISLSLSLSIYLSIYIYMIICIYTYIERE